MAGNTTLEGRKNKNALRLLERTIKVLDKCQIDYWLEGGTLLGIVRENRILPWDNDLDISIKDVTKVQIEYLKKALNKAGLRVRIRNFKADYGFGNIDDYRILKVRTKFLWFIKGPVVLDIFIKFTIEDQVKWVVNRTLKSVPKGLYDDFTKIVFNGYEYTIPAHYDEYLTYRYGNWRVPVKDWDTYKDDNAIAVKA